MIRALRVLLFMARDWKAAGTTPTAGHYRWQCAGCGQGGMKPDGYAARSDADAHAASHDFAYSYGLERSGSW